MPLAACAVFSACLALALVACSDSGSSSDAATGADAGTPDLGAGGGPIDAALSEHCATAEDGGPKVVTVDPAACHPDAGVLEDAGEAPHEHEEEAETMYGFEGDDDDCKYHLAISSTPIHRNQDATFTLVLTYKASAQPVTMAEPYIEAFLTPTHPAPEVGSGAEGAAGTYTIGPVRFDAPGDWTVRFHLSGDCADSEESPHGHGAFFIRVP